MDSHEVRDATERSRYELLVNGELVGVADYRLDGSRLVLPHTEIEPARRGQGLGEVLVRSVLDDARARSLTITPVCWFVAEFLDDHPEYADLRAA